MSQSQVIPGLPIHFILRRLHSLVGVSLLGIFLIAHVVANSFVLIPMFFYFSYGLVLIYNGEINVHRYGFAANWRYTLQRFTGIIAFAFIVYQLAVLWGPAVVSHTPVNLDDHRRMIFYIFGMLCLIFYFANGLWGFLIEWGITVSSASQRLSFKLCMAIFAILSVVNILAILNL